MHFFYLKTGKLSVFILQCSHEIEIKVLIYEFVKEMTFKDSI